LLHTDIKTYLVELLMKQDQMSMSASIESRVPFLDHKLSSSPHDCRTAQAARLHDQANSSAKRFAACCRTKS
jgi:asparagine synthetase B (glutamine-hydrolysing)